jgi:hypothetical protein
VRTANVQVPATGAPPMVTVWRVLMIVIVDGQSP